MKSPKEIISIDYDTLPIETKEIIWFGTLLYFSRPHNFPEGNDWSYLITASEIVIYQDENIRLTVGYGGSEYTIEYYNGNEGFSGEFETFFDLVHCAQNKLRGNIRRRTAPEIYRIKNVIF